MTNYNVKHQLKGYSTYWTQNNLLRHCITDKDWYIRIITLYTQQDPKCSVFYVPNFQILI